MRICMSAIFRRKSGSSIIGRPPSAGAWEAIFFTFFSWAFRPGA